MPKILFHGTDADSAKNILENGIDQSRSCRGYFGVGFYLAEEESLARSNYADFSGGDGVVLACEISDEANILDMSSEAGWNEWKNSGLERKIHLDDVWLTAKNMGIDGIKDNSFGGVVIYNPGVVSQIKIQQSLGDRPTKRRF